MATTGYTTIIDADFLALGSTGVGEETSAITGQAGVLVYDIKDEAENVVYYKPKSTKLYVNGVRWNRREVEGTVRSYQEKANDDGTYSSIELFTPVAEGAMLVVDFLRA